MSSLEAQHDPKFPCSLVIRIPFPSHRLANIAYQALSVDQELSALVERSFAVVAPADGPGSARQGTAPAAAQTDGDRSAAVIADRAGTASDQDAKTVLLTVYKATTNRMLRVAVNGFFDSLSTVVQVMEELDTDVLHEHGFQALEGVQGVEQGMTGTTLTGG